MTSVTFYTNEEMKYIGFNVEGHSGYSLNGRDIVCAGISVITQATMHTIENKLNEKCTTIVDPQKTKMMLIIDGDCKNIELVNLFIESMHCVIEELSNQYPAYVAFKDVAAKERE